ncbi:MAG: alpha/beta fold hydrolase [Sulfuriferula sp.]
MTAHADSYDAVWVLQDGRIISFCDYDKRNGIPIFQFHGTPGSRLVGLDGQEVSDAGLRIVTPERPGYGRSTANLNASIVSWVSDIQQLADQLGLERLHVLGVSGGGPYALACAAFLPNRVILATLVSGATSIELPGFWNGMAFWNKAIFFAAYRAPNLLYAICASLAWMATRDVQKRNAVPTHESEAFRQGGIGLYTDLRLIIKSWGIPFKKISVPVILWHGEEDVLAPIAGAKALASAIPSCDAHFLPGCGHFLIRDAAISEQILARLLSGSNSKVPA